MMPHGIGRSLTTKCPSSLTRAYEKSWQLKFPHNRQFHVGSSSPTAQKPFSIEQESRRKRQQHQGICRSFHRSVQAEIAPFLPEIVIATGIIGSWVVYRTSKGKPLTPDDALECQEAYKKQEEELRNRQPEWLRNRELKD